MHKHNHVKGQIFKSPNNNLHYMLSILLAEILLQTKKNRYGIHKKYLIDYHGLVPWGDLGGLVDAKTHLF